MSEDHDALREKYFRLLESAGMMKKSKMNEMDDEEYEDEDGMKSGDPKKKPSKSKKPWMAKKGDAPMEESK